MKRKKRKMKKPREINTLNMILHCKSGFMKDRREPRKGSKNLQHEYIVQALEAGAD